MSDEVLNDKPECRLCYHVWVIGDKVICSADICSPIYPKDLTRDEGDELELAIMEEYRRRYPEMKGMRRRSEVNEGYKGKGYRLVPILSSMNGCWGFGQTLYFFQCAIPITMRRDIHGYYDDLDEIKKELPEIWNKTEVNLRHDRDDTYAKLSDIIQAILVEEHDLFWDWEGPSVHSKTCRYVYVYPPKDFVWEEEPSSNEGDESRDFETLFETQLETKDLDECEECGFPCFETNFCLRCGHPVKRRAGANGGGGEPS